MKERRHHFRPATALLLAVFGIAVPLWLACAPACSADNVGSCEMMPDLSGFLTCCSSAAHVSEQDPAVVAEQEPQPRPSPGSLASSPGSPVAWVPDRDTVGTVPFQPPRPATPPLFLRHSAFLN